MDYKPQCLSLIMLAASITSCSRDGSDDRLRPAVSEPKTLTDKPIDPLLVELRSAFREHSDNIEYALERASELAHQYVGTVLSECTDELVRTEVPSELFRSNRFSSERYFLLTSLSDDALSPLIHSVVLALVTDLNENTRDGVVSRARVFIRTEYATDLRQVLASRSLKIPALRAVITHIVGTTYVDRFPLLDWSEIWYGKTSSPGAPFREYGFLVNVQCSTVPTSGAGWRGAFVNLRVTEMNGVKQSRSSSLPMLVGSTEWREEK